MDRLYEAIDALIKLKPVILAIDGPAAAGKSTLADRLKERYPKAQLFHMDDFFLKPHMRTAERLKEPGGNVDYERFLNEVLLPLHRGEAFQYGVYDCQTGNTRPVEAHPAPLNIIEGCYSLRPDLRGYYDLSLFLDIDPEKQAKRILQRNSDAMAQRFFSEWIPLENAYFEALNIREAADLVLTAGIIY